MKNHLPLLSESAGVWVLGLLLSMTSLSNAQEKAESFMGDLQILTEFIPEYHADSLSLEEATEKLMRLALGNSKKKDKLRIVVPVESMGTYTLDLKNVRVYEVFGVLSEMAYKSYEIQWNQLYGPDVEWTSKYNCDLYRFTKVKTSAAFRCSKKAASALGITTEMTPQEMANALTKYGAEFGSGATVIWNAKTETMVVRNIPSQQYFVQSLVTVIDKGWSLVKTESKQK